MITASLLLSALDLSDIVGKAAGAAAGGVLGSTIVWYPASSRVFNPAAGTVGYSGTAATFTALVGPADVDESKGIKAGDVAVLVPLSQVVPAVDDRFTAGGVMHVVSSIAPMLTGSGLSLVIASRVP